MALAFEEGAQRPVLAVVLAPEDAAVLQLGQRRKLGVILQRPQVRAQAAVAHAGQVDHRHLAGLQMASLAVGHHTQPHTGPGALASIHGTEGEKLGHHRFQVRQYRFPLPPLVRPEHHHRGTFQAGVESFGLLTQPLNYGVDDAVRFDVHGLDRIVAAGKTQPGLCQGLELGVTCIECTLA